MIFNTVFLRRLSLKITRDKFKLDLDEILTVWLTSKINRIYNTRLRTQVNLFRASAIQSSLLFSCAFLSGGHMSFMYLTRQCRRKRKLWMYKHLCKARGSALPADSSRFATKSPVVFHRSWRMASWNFCHLPDETY